MTTLQESTPARVEDTGRGAAGRLRRPDPVRILTWASPFLLLGLWQLGAELGWFPTMITSTPVAVVKEYWHLYTLGRLVPDTLVSLYRASLGAVIGFTAGAALGLVTGTSRWAGALLDTPVRMINAVPFPAVLPIFVLAFGLSEAPKIAFIAFIVSHPAYINTFAGVRGTDQKFLEVARVLRLSRWTTLRQVVIPSALPSVLVGLRYGLMYSVFGLIISEQLGSTNGLGFLISDAQVYGKFQQLMAIAVIYAFIGVGANLLARGLERLLVPWAYTRLEGPR